MENRIIDKSTIETLLIVLYQLQEFEAVDALLGAYKRIYMESDFHLH